MDIIHVSLPSKMLMTGHVSDCFMSREGVIECTPLSVSLNHIHIRTVAKLAKQTDVGSVNGW